MNKIYGIAVAVGALLAIVAALVAIPGINAAAVLVIIGLVAGYFAAADGAERLLLTTLALPVVSAALANVPFVGEQLGAIATNLGLLAAGGAAFAIGKRLFGVIKGAVTSATA